MEAERERDAAEFRAQGQEQFLRITRRGRPPGHGDPGRGQAPGRDPARRGEAERTRILNDAYGQDPDFFEFYRSMQAYEASIKPENSMLVMSPDNEFFDFFNSSGGRGDPPAVLTAAVQ